MPLSRRGEGVRESKRHGEHSRERICHRLMCQPLCLRGLGIALMRHREACRSARRARRGDEGYLRQRYPGSTSMSILTAARPVLTREAAPIFTGRMRLCGAGLGPHRLRAGSAVGRPSPATLGHSIGDVGGGVGKQGTTLRLGRRMYRQACCCRGRPWGSRQRPSSPACPGTDFERCMCMTNALVR
jgi:hypothetical protein